MTTRQLIRHYIPCTFAAITAWHYIHPAAAILAFAIVSAILIVESETRRRP